MDTKLLGSVAWDHSVLLHGEVPKATHQSNLRVLRTKAGRWFVGKSSRSPVLKWMRAITAAAHQSISKPNGRLDGPLAALIEFNFERPKTRRKKGLETTFMVNKPDLDNAAKAVLDAIGEAGWWHDDSQICILILVKTESDNPHLQIKVGKIA